MDITGLGSIADLVKTAVNKIWPDKSEQEKNEMTIAMLQIQGELDLAKGQMEVNKAEASSGNAFASSWRPLVGYVCASGLAFQFIIFPLGEWIAELCGKTVKTPNLDMGTLLTLLLGMLGLGGMRTFEKMKGVSK